MVNGEVKVYFLDNSGDIIRTILDWSCPRGTQTFPLAVIDGLPGNWVGQARVESQEWWSPGDPKVLPPNVVSVAELIRFDGPAQTVLLEGVTYNLFPEQQAFIWQIGEGGGGLESGVGLIGIPSFMNNMGGCGETGLTTELAIQNVVPKPGFTDFAMFIYDQNGLLDFVCEKLNEKQVEYINVADWNYINDGFKGSAVISATFWEHGVFDGEGPVRNLVGLAAVKVERFNWPLVPSTDPADDAPGDQASASEGFPINGPWNFADPINFDFEGPQAPTCPGFDCDPGTVRAVTTVGGVLVDLAGAVVNLSDGFDVNINLTRVATGTYTTGLTPIVEGGRDYTLSVTATGVDIPVRTVHVGCNGAVVTQVVPVTFTSTVFGQMWVDADADGAIDDDEGFRPGESVLIADAANTILGTAVTDGAGFYSITFNPANATPFGLVKVVWDKDADGAPSSGDVESALFTVLFNGVETVDIDAENDMLFIGGAD